MKSNITKEMKVTQKENLLKKADETYNKVEEARNSYNNFKYQKFYDKMETIYNHRLYQYSKYLLSALKNIADKI